MSQNITEAKNKKVYTIIYKLFGFPVLQNLNSEQKGLF